MASKTKFNLNSNNFPDFVSKLEDLSHISTTIKLKIDSEHILMYSILTNDGGSVLALKSYKLNTSEYISNYKDEDIKYDFILVDASKIVKSLKFYSSDNTISLEFTYASSKDDDEIMNVRGTHFNNGKLKISTVGGEGDKIKDLSKNVLEAYLDPKKSSWRYSISKTDFSDVKKLCNINSDEKIVTITVENGQVTLSQSNRWELKVDNIEFKDTTLLFNKGYLGHVNTDITDERIDFMVFPTFILISHTNCNLMLSFETDFSNEEEE